MHPLRGLKALSDGNKTAHEVANHVVQKSRRLKIKTPVGAVLALTDALNANMHDVFNWAERLAAGGTKRGEIVFAEQTLGSFLHGLYLHRSVDPAHPSSFQAGTNWRLQDDVGIAP